MLLRWTETWINLSLYAFRTASIDRPDLLCGRDTYKALLLCSGDCRCKWNRNNSRQFLRAWRIVKFGSLRNVVRSVGRRIVLFAENLFNRNTGRRDFVLVLLLLGSILLINQTHQRVPVRIADIFVIPIRRFCTELGNCTGTVQIARNQRMVSNSESRKAFRRDKAVDITEDIDCSEVFSAAPANHLALCSGGNISISD